MNSNNMNSNRWFRLTLISVATVGLLGTQALAQDTAPSAPSLEEPRSEPLTQPTAPAGDSFESQTPATETSCPPGQFASAFPDVLPDHWAYEAVNRLAIGPIQCFPITSQSSEQQ